MLLDINLCPAGLLGTLFEANKEAAFAAHKLCQAVSGFSLFMTAPYLCTDVKIFVVVTVLLVALFAYIALEVLLKVRKPKSLPIPELVVSVDGVESTKDDNDMKT